ncbi:ATP-binding protein [Listeria goaensis]|uniref:ATP-binding protein n=1 Tax=Listeria goaensis TaxID=1649188 RepID=UPI000B58C585|nr:AAA family ATPase [Listeria goaensis]
MKITAIAILGYGKWSNVTFSDLADFQLVYGGNEAGKSTIMAFIHSVLFGFPTKQSSIPRMEPKNKGPYGGKLTLADTKLGVVTVERLRGKATGDVTVQLENGDVFGEEKLAEILGEMDRQTYEAIFSFDIHGLQHVQQMKQAEFEKQLLVAGTAGSDTLLQALLQLEKQMELLFKPNGRNPQINQAIQATNKVHESYLSAKQNNDNYAKLLAKLTELDDASAERFNERKTLTGELSKLEWMKEKWPVYTEWQSLQEKIKPAADEFPVDGNIRLEHFLNRIRERENELLQLKERKKVLEDSGIQNGAIADKSQIGQIESQLEMWPIYQERKAAFLELQFEERKQLEQVTMEFDELPLHWTAETDQEVKQISREQEKLDNDVKTEELTRAFLQKEEDGVQEEIDALEEVMWPAEKWKESANHKNTSKWREFLWPTSMILTLFSVVLAMVFSSFWLYGLAVLFAASSLFFYMKRPAQNVEAQFIYEEQKKYRNKWQQLYVKMDGIAHKKAQSEMILQEKSEKKAYLEQKQALIYEKWDMPPKNDFSVDMAELKAQIELQNRLVDIKRQLVEKEKFIKDWEVNLFALPGDATSPEERVAYLRQSLISYRENQTDFAKREEKLDQLANQIDLLERDLRDLKLEKSNLMAQAGAHSEDDFRQKGLEAQVHQEAKARLLLLEAELPARENFAGYDELSKLKEQEFLVKQKIANLEAESREFERQRAELKHEIERLEEGGLYAEQKQLFYLAQTDLTELAEEWFVLKTAHEVLKQTVVHLQEEKFPKALQFASTYFEKLTHERYKRIYFENNRIRVENTEQVMFSPEELSQATKEQLYLSLRFALVETIADEYPFPILIDDGFVNFDQSRLDLMMELLRYKKTSNQVIFFTCHEETSKYFSPNDRLMLY